jgi:hypothetical protein
MSNRKKQKLKLLPNNVRLLKSSKQSQIPDELKQLDGQALGAVKPEANLVNESAKIVRGKSTANSVEFMLHEDGTLMKAVERPGAAPQHLLIDGDCPAKVFGIACNREVADMICNGTNALHLAHIMQAAEDAAKRTAASPSGAPTPFLLPPATTTLIPGDNT